MRFYRRKSRRRLAHQDIAATDVCHLVYARHGSSVSAAQDAALFERLERDTARGRDWLFNAIL